MKCGVPLPGPCGLVYIRAFQYRQFGERFMAALGSPLECSELASIPQTNLVKEWGEKVRQPVAGATNAAEVFSWEILCNEEKELLWDGVDSHVDDFSENLGQLNLRNESHNAC